MTNITIKSDLNGAILFQIMSNTRSLVKNGKILTKTSTSCALKDRNYLNCLKLKSYQSECWLKTSPRFKLRNKRKFQSSKSMMKL